MRNARMSRVGIWIILLMLTMSSMAVAQPGDCDFSGAINVADLTYLTSYLYAGGPQPDLIDCDCDGFPGVNVGDLWQLTQAMFSTATLFVMPGTDVPQPTTASLMVLDKPDGVWQTSPTIIVKTPVRLDAAVIVYSFAPGPGEADLSCTSVDFTGSVGTGLSANIDNVNHTIIITNPPPGPVLPVVPNWALFATANFTLVTLGNPVTLTATSTQTVFPMLLAQAAITGLDGVRVIYPTYAETRFISDADCSGSINISDVVYLVNYIFGGGPPPGDPDGDGIPNC